MLGSDRDVNQEKLVTKDYELLHHYSEFILSLAVFRALHRLSIKSGG